VTARWATREAFDSVATGYHQSNVDNPLLCAMRKRTLAAIRRSAAPGARLLDLGCGPGTDAETLASEGYEVIAIDASPRMVDEARLRVEAANLAGRVIVHHLDIDELDRLSPGCVDVAYSNFGPLNCLADLRRTAEAIARRLRPGGFLVASVIGRLCPWELALYGARGDFRRAAVRFAPDRVAVPLNGHIIWTRYYTPREFERPFRPAGFQRVSLRAIGLFAPPPYLDAFAGRRPSLVDVLHRLDDLVGGWPLLRNTGDHFLIVLQKGSRDA
jgi:SAM-dependent methyltransferase